LSVQRFVDIWISFPALVLLVSLIAIVGPGLWSTMLVLGILLAPGAARVVRSAALSVRVQPYIESARCLGAGDFRIVLRYVLPNVMAPILVLATTQLGAAILAESTIAFLGYGVPPPFPTWGSLLSGTGRAYMLQSPWLAIWPGLAISGAVFGFNMLGDALRDVLDPRLRGR
jgi:peptide/nickel transport system permease protein